MHVYSSDSPEIRRYLLRDVLRENEKNPGLYAWTKDAIGEHNMRGVHGVGRGKPSSFAPARPGPIILGLLPSPFTGGCRVGTSCAAVLAVALRAGAVVVLAIAPPALADAAPAGQVEVKHQIQSLQQGGASPAALGLPALINVAARRNAPCYAPVDRAEREAVLRLQVLLGGEILQLVLPPK